MIGNELFRWASAGKLTTLAFHKIPLTHDPLRQDEITLNDFENILKTTLRRFKIIAFEEAITRLNAGNLPERTATLTFDDGYSSWLDFVVPLLERHGIPATFFVTTGQIDSLPLWNERILHAIRNTSPETPDLSWPGIQKIGFKSLQEKRNSVTRLDNFLKYRSLGEREAYLRLLEAHTESDPRKIKALTSDSLKIIHQRGFEIGAHTINHPILTRCTDDEARREITGSKQHLETLLGVNIAGFAFPNGKEGKDFGPQHIEMIKEAGYKYAVTTNHGVATKYTHCLQLPRITPWKNSGLGNQLSLFLNLTQKSTCKAKPSKKTNKILYVENGGGFGGAIVALNHLIDNMPKNSIEAYVVSNTEIRELKENESIKDYVVIKDRLVSLESFKLYASSTKNAFFRKTLQFTLGRIDDLINRMPFFFRLMTESIRLSPDLIHGNNNLDKNREAFWVAKMLRVPYVQHTRGPANNKYEKIKTNILPDAYIPVSKWLEMELISALKYTDRVYKIYDGIEWREKQTVGKKSIVELCGLEQSAPTIAMIGMLLPWKGQLDFVEAVRILASRNNSNANYIIIGGSPQLASKAYENQIKNKITEYGLESKIKLTGHISDLPDILSSVDVVVSCSKEPEPLGLVMLESMICGCIFVGPNFGAAPEFIDSGRNGFLYQPNCIDSLSESLILAHNSIDRKPDIARINRELIFEKTDARKSAIATLRIYEAQLAKK